MLWNLIWKGHRYRSSTLCVDSKRVDIAGESFTPDVVSDYLCDFMERNRTRPFLAYYPMILPHSPFIRMPGSGHSNLPDPSDKRAQANTKFPDMIHYMDAIVGKLLDKLQSLGIAENTLVVFVGDNGTDQRIASMMGEGVVRGGKGTTTERGTHVPMIARWPAATPGGVVSDALIDFSDFLPTMLALSEAPGPEDLRLDGVSFAPLLLGRPFEGRRWSYAWYQKDGIRERAWQIARDRRYKLYAKGRFIDTVTDPLELRPVPADEMNAEQRVAHADLSVVLDRQMAVAAAFSE
jgi:arylsulfatase A